MGILLSRADIRRRSFVAGRPRLKQYRSGRLPPHLNEISTGSRKAGNSHQLKKRARDGNRTHITSLEDCKLPIKTTNCYFNNLQQIQIVTTEKPIIPFNSFFRCFARNALCSSYILVIVLKALPCAPKPL